MTLMTLGHHISTTRWLQPFWKHVDFSKHQNVVEYTESHAELGWLPSSRTWMATSVILLQRFYERTCVHSYGRRRRLWRSTRGCVTSMRVQTKSLLPSPGERDIELYGQVWPNFDWVRGGEAPGLCGAKCLTGCKEVTGLDGWSSRNMWRPCVWPPSILIKH
jgi:hypothetical protein